MTDWSFQKKAVDSLVDEFKRASRAQIVMACGSGKTRVGRLAVSELDARKTVVFVPSLALVDQTIEEYLYGEYSQDSILAVCSDVSIESERGVTVTEEEDVVEQHLRRRGPRLVVCTYQSAGVLSGCKFDLGIFDEAHKTVGEEGKAFAFALHDCNVKIDRRLFMTATPKRFDKIKDMPDMGNSELYGEVAFSLPIREAIGLGIVCDYRISVSAVIDDHLKVEAGPRPFAVALASAMRKTSSRKVFTYHRTVNEARSLLGEYSKAINGVRTLHVNGDMDSVQRYLQMAEFRKAKISIMTNARCLIEGVNVPAVDLVSFAHPKRSVVDIVQAVGRTMRISPGKKCGNVLVPLLLRSDESLEDGLERTKFDYLYSVMQAMQEQDTLFSEAIKQYDAGDESALDDLLSVDGPDIDLAVLKKSIITKMIKRVVRGKKYWRGEILKEAKRSKERPKRRNDRERLIAEAVDRYVGRVNGYQFDPELRKEVEAIAPSWFMNSATDRKERFLEMARTGKPRPSWQTDRKDRELLSLYLKKGSKVYDAKFAADLKSIAPDWVETIYTAAKKNKAELLRMARAGEKKPSSSSRDKSVDVSLGAALNRYVSPINDSYDAKFHKDLASACNWRLPKGMPRK